jgi:hypothetical protein
MASGPPKRASSKQKLSWYQLSLCSLLIFTIVFGIGLSWFVSNLRRAARQRAAVEAIVKMKGCLLYDYDLDEAGDIVPGKLSQPAWLRNLLGDDYFRSVSLVDFSEGEVKGPHLEYVKDLQNLRYLYDHRTQVTDTELRNIEGLTKLQSLDLSGTSITESGLAHLNKLTTLEVLWLDDTRITDAGLEHLQALPRLQTLSLSGTNITDAALQQLKRLTQLQSLNLTKTKVTDAGVKDLQKALPNCNIEH